MKKIPITQSLLKVVRTHLNGSCVFTANPNLPEGYIHEDIKLENLLFEDEELTGVLDFDDFRYTYLIEEIVRTAMHDLHDPGKNLIRSGHLGQYLSVFKPSDLTYFSEFVQARLLYDLSSYLSDGHADLVEELLADVSLQQYINKFG